MSNGMLNTQSGTSFQLFTTQDFLMYVPLSFYNKKCAFLNMKVKHEANNQNVRCNSKLRLGLND